MTSKLSKKEVARSFGSLFRVLEVLNKADITGTTAQAVVLVASRTIGSQNPRPVTPVQVHDATGLSVSAATRLMAKLADRPKSKGGAFVVSHKSAQGSGRDAYVLTEDGREFVTSLLSAYLGHPVALPETQAMEALDQAQKPAVSRPGSRLRKGAWDAKALTLVVSPAEVFLSDDIQAWCTEFLSEKPMMQELTKDGAIVKFGSEPDAVYFTLRWC